MPRYDGTGPLGFGSGTGWGRGPCGGGMGYGRRGIGRGQKLGWGRNYPVFTPSKEEEKEILKEELEAIKSRLTELKG